MIPEPVKSPFNLGSFDANLAAALDRVEKDPDFVREITSERQGNPITLGPPVISPDEWADKQQKNATAAAETWHKNVQRPRREPIKAALAASEKRANKVREALEQKKWDKALEAVDEDVMYEVIRQTGAEGYRRGVQARAAKVKAKVTKLQPMVTALKLEIEKMPDATDADREARLLAGRKGMIAIGKKLRGIP